MLFEIQAVASVYQTKMAQYSLYSVEEKCVSLAPLCNRLLSSSVFLVNLWSVL